MRVCGDSEDCSAAEARRSSDSLDSPPLFMVGMSVSMLRLNGRVDAERGPVGVDERRETGP